MTKILSHSPRTNNPKKGGSGPPISDKHSFTIDRTPHLVLDTSQCSQESEDSNSDLKVQIVGNKNPSGNGQSGIIFSDKGVAPTIMSGAGNPNRKREIGYSFGSVLVSPKSTNTQTSSLQTNSQKSKTMEMQQKLSQVNFQTLICSVEDFLASHSQSLESGEVSQIPEAQCFSILQEYLKLKNLVLCSSKMSKAYSITTKGKLSKSSFKRFQNWGMMFNGWFLTASFSEFPRTERGYSLSEVLEEQVDQKYYLSDKAKDTIMKSIQNHDKKSTSLMMSQESIKENKETE